MSKRLGLIIGIDTYQDPQFRPSQFAENDARALAHWLVNARGGNWPAANVQHIQGSRATTELIQSLITQMCITIAEPGDLAVIYFAGHVFVDERTGSAYLALVDTQLQHPSTALPLNPLVQNIMTQSRASHILLILDSIQTGPVPSLNRTSPYDFKPIIGLPLVNTLQQLHNRFFLCSCRGNAMLPEAGENNLGHFMRHLIIGLSGQALDPTIGSVTLRQLHTYLFNALGEQQRPQLFGQEHQPLLLTGSLPDNGQPQFPLSATSSPTRPASGPPNPPFRQPVSGQLTATEGGGYPVATAQAQRVTPNLSTDQRLQEQCSILLAKAQQLLQKQDYAEAFQLVEQALQVIPNDLTALTLKCRILGLAGRDQEAAAVIDQILQIAPNHAIGWYMRAILLSNHQQYQEALNAVERSLALDATNAEAQTLKQKLLTQMPPTQQPPEAHTPESAPPPTTPSDTELPGNIRTFFTILALQILGFMMGTIGAALPVIRPELPSFIGLALISFGLAILCVNAARAAYRYGILHTVPTVLICLVTGGVFAALYKFGFAKITTEIKLKPQLVVPVLFLSAWLIIATLLPFFCACGGLMSRALRSARKKKQ